MTMPLLGSQIGIAVVGFAFWTDALRAQGLDLPDMDEPPPVKAPAANAPKPSKHPTPPDWPKGKDVDFAAFDAQGEVRQYVLTLEDASAGNAPLEVRVWKRGSQFGMAWGTSPAAPAYCYPVMAGFSGFYNLPPACELKEEGGKLTGTIFQSRSGKYTVQATVNGAAISGAYTGTLTADKKDTPVQGTVHGKVLSEADLRQQNNPLAPNAAYPCWRNNGSGVGFETGGKLVDDPSRARVVWKSEELIPPGYHEGINFYRPCGIQTGHASPILADGKVFLNYFTGSPKNEDDAGVKTFMESADHVPMEMAIKKASRTADQIMVAMDAQTGQTLWKFVAKEDGPNVSRGGSDSRHKLFGPSSKAASHLTSCYGAGPSTGSGQGKVFFKGTGGIIYCLDAKTGAEVWKSGTYQKPERGQAEAATDSCQFADGVMATGKGGGLTGFDAASGKELWTLKGAVGGRQTHLRWICDGKEYFLTPRGQLVEPKSGKVLWTADFPPSEKGVVSGVISTGDGYLLHGGTDSITCYRVTLQEAKRLWTTKEHSVWREIHPVIYQGHAYVRAVTAANRARSAAATYCFNLESGKITGQATGTKSFSSVIGGDGRIFNCNAALVILQSMDPAKFADLKAGSNAPSSTVADASMPIVFQGQPETTAIYADGRIFTRTFDGIVCYDLRAK